MRPNAANGGGSLTSTGEFGSLRRLTRDLLKAHGLRANKRLGQNFLVDNSAAATIIQSAEIQPTDHVLEIGAGLGALTVPLAAAAESVVAVEVDDRLMKALVDRTRLCTNVRIVRADFLDIPMDDLVPPTTELRWKVVANLPYCVTSPILEKLYAHQDRFDRFVLTVQREVAERLTALPGSREYGSLTVFTQYHADVRAVAALPPEAFLPSPKVESTVLRMLVRETPPVDVPDPEMLFRVVRAAFAHRRKTLLNSMASANATNFGKALLREAIPAAGISPEVRGETLSLADFARLTNELARRSDGR